MVKNCGITAIKQFTYGVHETIMQTNGFREGGESKEKSTVHRWKMGYLKKKIKRSQHVVWLELLNFIGNAIGAHRQTNKTWHWRQGFGSKIRGWGSDSGCLVNYRSLASEICLVILRSPAGGIPPSPTCLGREVGHCPETLNWCIYSGERLREFSWRKMKNERKIRKLKGEKERKGGKIVWSVESRHTSQWTFTT